MQVNEAHVFDSLSIRFVLYFRSVSVGLQASNLHFHDMCPQPVGMCVPHEAWEIVKDDVPRSWDIENVLQKTTGAHEPESTLIHNFHKFANELFMFRNTIDIESS
jgi:hypothetical protein